MRAASTLTHPSTTTNDTTTTTSITTTITHTALLVQYSYEIQTSHTIVESTRALHIRGIAMPFPLPVVAGAMVTAVPYAKISVLPEFSIGEES